LSTNYSLTGNARNKKNNLSQRDVKKTSLEHSKYLNFDKIKGNLGISVDITQKRKIIKPNNVK
jgi:hypothetical protein